MQAVSEEERKKNGGWFEEDDANNASKSDNFAQRQFALWLERFEAVISDVADHRQGGKPGEDSGDQDKVTAVPVIFTTDPNEASNNGCGGWAR